jgi:hypothetical protein
MSNPNGPLDRPEEVQQEHLTYLDSVRESGVINMWGAGMPLADEFGLSRPEAGIVLMYWMKSFDERHPPL